jgi:hypothetical protein
MEAPFLLHLSRWVTKAQIGSTSCPKATQLYEAGPGCVWLKVQPSSTVLCQQDLWNVLWPSWFYDRSTSWLDLKPSNEVWLWVTFSLSPKNDLLHIVNSFCSGLTSIILIRWWLRHASLMKGFLWCAPGVFHSIGMKHVIWLFDIAGSPPSKAQVGTRSQKYQRCGIYSPTEARASCKIHEPLYFCLWNGDAKTNLNGLLNWCINTI